ncbi:MAG: hypothetical protein AAFQ53_00285 [Bacteroidota bacterium]
MSTSPSSSTRQRKGWRAAYKRLSPDEVSRTRRLVNDLEREVLFDPEATTVHRLISDVRFDLNRGVIACSNVGPLAEALATHVDADL